MQHDGRRFCVVDVKSLDDLAGRLTERVWPRCTGFRFRGYLFLNDSNSEYGSQVYAVIREPSPSDPTFRQVETVTIAAGSLEPGVRVLLRIVRGEMDSDGQSVPWPDLSDRAAHRCCRLC